MAAVAAPAVDLIFNLDDNDDWWPPKPPKPPLARKSTMNVYGVTVIGRGLSYESEPGKANVERHRELQREAGALSPSPLTPTLPLHSVPDSLPDRPALSPRPLPSLSLSGLVRKPPPSLSLSGLVRKPPPSTISIVRDMAFTTSPIQSPASSPMASRPASPSQRGPGSLTRSPNISRPGTPRPRRRSSQQRVSLIAGRLSVLAIEPPPELPHRLVRSGSARSFLSVAASVGPPTPSDEREEFSTGRSLAEFVVEREIGRGAYGLVKRAREMDENGKMGPPLVIKQIIKTRILADCWKRHPKHGTIPIEIYVMNAISSTSYGLPARRPWDPYRLLSDAEKKLAADEWIEGKVVKGHPNICPMLDFFEDDQYYYMVMPSTTPENKPGEPPAPSDLFDLVEAFPQGLAPEHVRSYLGQIADGLAFLHSKGIVHRDIKDENVVLGERGKAILIDFGSSGLVKKTGWDTFSGTLDYAGPEILRGERYFGKEQDVWAFGVVAYVLLVGECPFTTAAEAQDGLASPFSSAVIGLDERCGEDHAREGEEADGGGALGDGAALVRACLQVDLALRPTFDQVLQSRFLMGRAGWVELPPASADS